MNVFLCLEESIWTKLPPHTLLLILWLFILKQTFHISHWGQVQTKGLLCLTFSTPFWEVCLFSVSNMLEKGKKWTKTKVCVNVCGCVFKRSPVCLVGQYLWMMVREDVNFWLGLGSVWGVVKLIHSFDEKHLKCWLKMILCKSLVWKSTQLSNWVWNCSQIAFKI